MLRISSIDSESKQRFLGGFGVPGQLSEPLKCPKTASVGVRPAAASVLILKLARGKLALMVWGC